jgi:hypothetical protein
VIEQEAFRGAQARAEAIALAEAHLAAIAFVEEHLFETDGSQEHRRKFRLLAIAVFEGVYQTPGRKRNGVRTRPPPGEGDATGPD